MARLTPVAATMLSRITRWELKRESMCSSRVRERASLRPRIRGCERTVGIGSQHIPTGRGRRNIRPRHKFVPRLVRRNRVLVTSPSFFSDWDFLLSETRLPSLHHWSRISRCLDRSPEMLSWTPPHSFHANTAYRSVCVHAKTVVPVLPRSVSCSITPAVVPPPALYRNHVYG